MIRRRFNLSHINTEDGCTYISDRILVYIWWNIWKGNQITFEVAQLIRDNNPQYSLAMQQTTD